jgi:thymidylate synthase
MRANDALAGLLCDVFAFTLIQEFIAQQIGARLGTYTHHADSMHVNDPDLQRAKHIVACHREGPHFPIAAMPRTTWDDITAIGRLEEALRQDKERLDPAGAAAVGLASYWQQVLLLFEVYRQIIHDDGRVSPSILAALDPGHQHLVAWRWPDAMPSEFMMPGASTR